MAKSISKKTVQHGLTVNGSLWIEKKGKRFFGPGPLQLLELIAETGSIRQAAGQMQMSYKKAWQIINNLNTMAGKPLVVKQSGGEKGGGSVVTDEAKLLINRYKLLRNRFRDFLEKETVILD
jgi:molybdate transport system regulatory protein